MYGFSVSGCFSTPMVWQHPMGLWCVRLMSVFSVNTTLFCVCEKVLQFLCTLTVVRREARSCYCAVTNSVSACDPTGVYGKTAQRQKQRCSSGAALPLWHSRAGNHHIQQRVCV